MNQGIEIMCMVPSTAQTTMMTTAAITWLIE